MSATVFVVILLSGIYFNFLSFISLFFVVSLLGLREYYSITEKLGARPYKVWGYIAGTMLYASGVFSNSNLALFYNHMHLMNLAIASVFTVYIVALFSNHEKPITNIAYTVAGIIYTVVPFVLLMSISCFDKAYTFNHPAGVWYVDMAPYNSTIIFGIIFLIWANDTFAYLTGSLIGKHKLFERVSPGKTWEGSIGGAVFSLGVAFLISKWFTDVAMVHWLVIAGIVIVFGTIGDLVESMIKRHAGIKDSGNIMPGHGGVLDRFDSLLFVSPFVFFYITIVFS